MSCYPISYDSLKFHEFVTIYYSITVDEDLHKGFNQRTAFSKFER